MFSLNCNNIVHDCLKFPFRWEPGPKPFDGLWAPYWYRNTHKSTGFELPKNYPSVSYRGPACALLSHN